MSTSKTRNTRRILAGLNFSGIDRIYQQLDTELGMILTFHHVRPDPVPEFAPNAHLAIRPEFLEEVIQLLRYREIEIVSLEEALQRIEHPSLGKRFAVLTFDDGYHNTLDHAAPILRRHRTPYTVYVAPGLIEGSAGLWWEGIEELVRSADRIELDHPQTGAATDVLDCETLEGKRAAFDHLVDHLINETPEKRQGRRVELLCSRHGIDLPAITRQQMMSWQDVAGIQQDPLCTIGAHTHNHEALARLTLDEAREEVSRGADALEQKTGKRPVHFAYPYGYRAAAAEREFGLLRDIGFHSAVTTRGGMIFPEHKNHLTALPRISVNGLFQHLRYFAPLISGLPTRLSTGFRRVDAS